MQCDAMQHKTAEVWDCKNTSADEVKDIQLCQSHETVELPLKHIMK